MVIDLWFFGIINIFNTEKDYQPFQKFLAIVCVLLSVFDILEIIQKTRQIRFASRLSVISKKDLDLFALEKAKKLDESQKVNQKDS